MLIKTEWLKTICKWKNSVFLVINPTKIIYRIPWVLALCVLLLASCGGEGTTTVVSKVAEIVFEFDDTRQQEGPLMLKVDMDVMTAEFEEFLDGLEQADLDAIDIQVTGLSQETSVQLSHLFMGVDPVKVDTSNLFLISFSSIDLISAALPLTNRSGEIINTDRIRIYEKGEGSSLLGNANKGISIIKEALREVQSLQFGVGVDSFDGIHSGFSVHIFLDITIRTRIT